MLKHCKLMISLLVTIQRKCTYLNHGVCRKCSKSDYVKTYKLAQLFLRTFKITIVSVLFSAHYCASPGISVVLLSWNNNLKKKHKNFVKTFRFVSPTRREGGETFTRWMQNALFHVIDEYLSKISTEFSTQRSCELFVRFFDFWSSC